MSAPFRHRATIGLEVHCQVKTETKMFCACRTGFGDAPNTHVCPVCLGLPGALPVVNRRAVEQTILAGLLLGSRIPEVTSWDRKNYFYPDLPKNYQISQVQRPVCVGGGLQLDTFDYPQDARKTIARPGVFIRLNHIHLEEDVGKSTHCESHSLIDFNRAGTPLLEIVTEADLESAEEAVACLNAMRQMLVYGAISDADMEKGQMRCDVNLSVRPDGQEALGPKVELKNLNSIGAVRRAIRHEIERQSADLDRGIVQEQSTRRWDDDRGGSQVLRTKEDAHDYRYFPDPDLVPVFTAALVAAARTRVPELPGPKRARFARDFGVTPYDAAVLAADRALADWFERAATGSRSPKRVANWLINELMAWLNDRGLAIDRFPVAPGKFRELVDLVDAGTLSQSQAREVFRELCAAPDKDPATIAKEEGFEQVNDCPALEAAVAAVLARFPDEAAEAAAGNAKVFNWLAGQVMKDSGGKANPGLVAGILRRKAGI